MIFVPITRADAESLRSGNQDPAGERTGYAATPALMRAHGFDARSEEEASFTAQTYAMIVGLQFPDAARTGRIVLAADAPVGALNDRDTPDGEIGFAGLEWRWVQAVFSDGAEPAAATLDAVRAAGHAAHGASDLGAAVDLPAVEELIDRHDLLWHNPDERW